MHFYHRMTYKQDMLKSKLYNFLIAPKYRIWRHILFVLAFALISFRQTSYIFRDKIDIVQDYIPLLSLITLTVYLVSLYANIYFFVPCYLLNKKYKRYLLSVFAIIFIQIAYLLIMEYVVRNELGLPHKIPVYNLFTFIQCIPSSTINLMCILGTSATVLFKRQAMENERITRIEQENIKSELDRLKEQLSPDFLSKILNKTSVLVTTVPRKASDMLMRLSGLLRYQLYDCNRDRVLLSAEVNFIRSYLELEKMYNSRFEYEFTVDKKLKDIFIPPMLFIPFIQHAIMRIENSDEFISMHVSFTPEKNALLFICRTSNKVLISEVELYAIKKRLDLIYPDEGYFLSVVHNEARLQLKDITV